MLELIIWDWSGTISDDRISVWRANNRMRSHYGLYALEFYDWLFETCTTMKGYFEQSGVDVNMSELRSLFSKYFTETINAGFSPQIYPDAMPVLEKIKKLNIPSVVISRHPEEFVNMEVSTYGLDNFFEELFCTVDSKSKIMRKVCKSRKVDLKKVLSIGDMPSDVLDAKVTGILAGAICEPSNSDSPRGYSTFKKLKETNPDYLFSDLSEILQLI